jgi:hypothetical protein
MKSSKIAEIYDLISAGMENTLSRQQSFSLRKKALSKLSEEQEIIKVAFDTRRVNQEIDYIPRRGLQNYHRSEQFISDAMMVKIQSFYRLASVLETLKSTYGKEPEWQDSYTRVLHAAVEKGLRTKQSDGDFSEMQPSVGSLDYLQELMYVRYRLTPEDLSTMSKQQLCTAILNKDENLLHKGSSHIISPSSINKYTYDQMVDAVIAKADLPFEYKKTVESPVVAAAPIVTEDNLSKLFNVKATKDMPDVERTVTITIKDKINDRIEKLASLSINRK